MKSMKTRNILLCLTMAVTGVLATSCNDMLDIPQHGSTSFDTFYKTDEEAEEAITAVYSRCAGIYFDSNFIKNLLSDDYWCGGGGRGDNTSMEQLNEYTFSAEHSNIQSLFSGYYSIIYLSNVVLTYVPDETEVQKRARAEAKVFRAFAYIDLISMWGTPPLVTKPLNPSEYKQPNGDPAALWKLVETDLTEAISSGSLREKSSIDDDSSYRITTQFAKALLGKAYVFQGKWPEACTTLDDMIDDGKYDLYRGNYEDMLMYTHENNCESLFEINRLDDPNNATMSMYAAMVGWRTGKMNFTICAKAASVFSSENPNELSSANAAATIPGMRNMNTGNSLK